MLILSLIIILVLVLSDQLIKIWVIENLTLNQTVDFITLAGKKILNLTYLQNDGAAFGSFSNMRYLLIIITTLLIIGCIYLMIRSVKDKDNFSIITLSVIIGGGIGNLIDRIFRGGKVIDYIEVGFMDFAIFNLADCFVVVGAILFGVYIVFFEEKKKTLKSLNAHNSGEKSE